MGLPGLMGERGPARESQYGTVDPGLAMQGQTNAASAMAARGDADYGRMAGQLQGDRAYLQGLRSGDNSLAREQLRQGLQQQYGQMQSSAASAQPGSQPMAARTAMMGMGRAGTGMSGNAAMAGIQERNAAAQTLAGLNLQQRGQDANYALGNRGLAVQGLSALEQARLGRYQADMGSPSGKEVALGALSGGLAAYGNS